MLDKASYRVQDALKAIATSLHTANIPDAHLSAEYLTAMAVGGAPGTRYRHATLQRAHGHVLTTDQVGTLERLVTQRLVHRVPVQMLVGTWDFHGVEVVVRRGVLCPRPETETLVDLALQLIATRHNDAVAVDVDQREHDHDTHTTTETVSATADWRKNTTLHACGNAHATSSPSPDATRDSVQQPVSVPAPRILDIGSGTGAVGLAILHACPTALCDAIDVDEAATTLSHHNAELLGLAGRYTCDTVGITDFAQQHARKNWPRYDLVGESSKCLVCLF